MNEMLPVEMLVKIFSYLSVREHLCLRSVCKLWNSILSNLKYAKLIIIRNGPCQPVGHREVAVCEPAKSIYTIELPGDNCFSNLTKEAIFKNVKQMTAFFSGVNYIYLKNFYNQFVRLESLVIDSNHTSILERPKSSGLIPEIPLNLKF